MANFGYARNMGRGELKMPSSTNDAIQCSSLTVIAAGAAPSVTNKGEAIFPLYNGIVLTSDVVRVFQPENEDPVDATPFETNIIEDENVVLVLPDISASTVGTVVHVVNASKGNLTIRTDDAGDTILFVNSDANRDLIQLKATTTLGDFVRFTCSSATAWSVTNCLGTWTKATPAPALGVKK